MMSLPSLNDPTFNIDMSDHPYGVPHEERAERLNGRLAMLGVVAAVGAYALTGQIIPGIW